MERVCVIGCSGSGKSTLSRALAPILGLPLIHFDREYWLPGWTKPDEGSWRQKVAAMAAEPRWLIDGNFSGTLVPRVARADAVVFLDFPAAICLWRVMKRVALGCGRTRPDAAPGCPEQIDLDFFRYVATFRQVHRPIILARLKGFEGELFTLTRPREVRTFLDEMKRRAA